MGVVFKPTKVSIVIAVLNSHRIVRRQIRHFRRMRLPDDIEIIIIDDGSNPRLQDILAPPNSVPNIYIYATNDFRPWTQGLARNMGAKLAQGEYLFFTDIDHILSREAIMAVHEFTGDKMVFERMFAFLNSGGGLITDDESVLKFGLSKQRYKRHKLGGGYHTNTFAMKKSLFVALDGFNPAYCEQGFHVGGKYMSEERNFYLKYSHLVKCGQAQPEVIGPRIFVYPVGRFHETGDENPHGLFHGIPREQVPQKTLEPPTPEPNKS